MYLICLCRCVVVSFKSFITRYLDSVENATGSADDDDNDDLCSCPSETLAVYQPVSHADSNMDDDDDDDIDAAAAAADDDW